MRQGRFLSRILFASLFVGGLCVASGVAAQGAANRAAAQALFDQGRNLMKDGKFDEACPKLEESQRLDPAIGTQFNLASCYEKAGKTASAWTLYLEVAAETRKLGQSQREEVARSRAKVLEAQLLARDAVYNVLRRDYPCEVDDEE